MNYNERHGRLRRRAELLSRLRKFFADRGFLEVETPLLDREIIPELHIEPFAVESDASSRELTARRSGAGDATTASPASRWLAATGEALWLQASPELHMKRLLAEGLPAIYQVTRSFRYGERGQLHNPEFTIVEWYRTGDTMEAGMELLDALCQEVASARPAVKTTYRQAFLEHAGVDPHVASCDELAGTTRRLGIAVPDATNRDDRDEWLNLLLAMAVEPKLGAAGPEILYDYPASQSSLAATVVREDGVEVAERFELYWRGIELANGFHELTDAAVLRRRLEKVNEDRAAYDRPPLLLPEQLLKAMEDPGLPPCSGCALGFDRLAMLACGATSIDDVVAFPWRIEP
ncbi:MAG TPA: elongation factor P--(R)-beta-lysine ligase [Lacipirellula sp.]